jgi:hypothetical protein
MYLSIFAILKRERVQILLRRDEHYVIKFVSDLRQVGGFLRVLRFPSPIKLTATI